MDGIQGEDNLNVLLCFRGQRTHGGGTECGELKDIPAPVGQHLSRMPRISEVPRPIKYTEPQEPPPIG